MRQLIPGSPAEQNYHFPPEWHQHKATWLSWPHKEESWPGKLDTVFPVMASFVKALSVHELVCINVLHSVMRDEVTLLLKATGVNMGNIEFFLNPTNDAWCRDHGPAFLINPEASVKKVIVDWGYNAWGNKYPPFDLDDVIPTRIGKELGIPVYHPALIMEGGSVDFNGAGTLITSKSCLLNPNRNPGMSQEQIETFLYSYYGVDQVLWLGEGIVGDDTDGHVDDMTRFVSSDTVLTAVEHDAADDNYEALNDNLESLKKMRLLNGKQLNIIELPMPRAIIYEDVRLPASYANFYIANEVVIVPTYDDPNDDEALEIIASVFPEREVVGIGSTDLIWGLGSFHCLSQQEPMI